jgi:uncharacterized protein
MKYLILLILTFNSLFGFGSMSDYLLFSAEKGHIQNVKKALVTGGDINSKDYFGKTALIYAVTRGDMELIQLLFKYGAASSIHFKDREGNTALDYAKLNKNERVIAVLKEYGAKD